MQDPSISIPETTQAYDRDGNVTAEGRTLAGVSGDAGTSTQTFSYDGLNRVTGSSGLTTTASYAYDRDANRTSATLGGVTTTYAYDRSGALVSRYDAPTTTTYTYDGYGNLTAHASAVTQTTTFSYDLGDRLLTQVLPGVGNNTTSFSLDALGRIASRTPPGGSAEAYSYLGTSETVWAIGSPTPVSAALDPSGGRVATKSGSTTGFGLPDLHANLVAVTTSGETGHLAAARYDPYGQTVATWDSGGGFPTPWRFQGRLDLSANSADPLYEFSARYYLPATGTFSQLDSYGGSVGDPRSLNRYLYAAANPWTLIDPSGHAFQCGDGLSGCGGGSPPPKPAPPKPAPSQLGEVPSPTPPPAGGSGNSPPMPGTPPSQASAPPIPGMGSGVGGIFQSPEDAECAQGLLGAYALGHAAGSIEMLSLAGKATVIGAPLTLALDLTAFGLVVGAGVIIVSQCTDVFG